jgi:hypothetical protein
MMSFKSLDMDNWKEPDPTSMLFSRVSPLVGVTEMREQDWAREILSVEVAAHVPEDVRELFAVARGALLYGVFFYPLFYLAQGQIYRVAEAGARERYRQLGGPKSRPRFADAVAWLLEAGHIPSEHELQWEAMRELRNHASHPSQVVVMPPGQGLGSLRTAALCLNRLFRPSLLGTTDP